MSMTKSQCGILVNVFYQLNKIYTFTNSIRLQFDNNNIRNKNKKINKNINLKK